ncbi:hypothetical protein L1049_006781 [Liquidambar formosana]|uniref:Protein kinase domain-containing protein n=1 Tax=Liquidambar formosana TaxID=63359 RepID=A0AAP0RG69_LIQFO
MKKPHNDQSRHLSFPLLYLFILNSHLITSATADNMSYASAEKVLLDCGSSESSVFNGKNWIGEVNSKFMPSASDGTTTTGVASNPDPEVPKVPYITARIIYSSFTYAFPLSPGPKFIRLYFHVASYSGLNPSKAYFSVVAGRYTLLSDFRPSVTADSLNSTHFTRDFSVYVKEGRLNITFNPSPTTSNAFAFVNGIEIFSMPLNLYIPHGNGSLPFIGQHDPFIIHDDETALEMLYQVNVGVLLERVITSIFGAWIDDLSYISGSQHGISVDSRNLFNAFNYTSGILLDYAAPLGMYSSARTMENDETFNVNYNLTWTFPVDSGFKYLVRLHFCEISFEVTQVNQRVFNVYINNQTAENALDLVALTGAPFVTVYRDYVVMVPNGTKNKQDLWLALHPNMESKPKYANAILNGIEILKLSDGSNNLAAYERLVNEPPAKKRRPFIIIVGGVFGGIAGLFLICYTVVHIARNGGKRVSVCAARVSQFSTADRHRNANVPVIKSSSSDLCRQFSLAEIRAATNNMDEALVIGSGGFGRVYRGFVDGEVTQVAIKRGNPQSNQGVREFHNEIDLLSTFHHTHLVSLIGYCQEDREMILVYEYMARGTLRDHLYKTRNPPLLWIQRLKICIGAARGLHYLHTGAKYSIIHRDVKSTNILLDEAWVAKVSDFGLSRVGSVTASCSHVSTEVKGTFGYLDPEYYRRRRLTEKSDVYSFGVVLFEVLCNRPAVTAVEQEDEEASLAEWALHCHQSGSIDRMIDANLRGTIGSECLVVYVEIAAKCLAHKGIERPSMGEVLKNLEHALTLQGSVDAHADGPLKVEHQLVR